jgi:O-antigen/teichoic acid export membrane protein
VHFGLGERWVPAIGLLAAFGIFAAFRQVAFNWQIFMRAVNRTRPILVVALGNVAVLFAITIPCVIAFGLTGYAVGSGVALLLELAARAYFLRRLFVGFSVLRHLVRAVLPSIPATLVVLGMRLVAGHEQTLAGAIALLALYTGVTVVATLVFERPLVVEVMGYLRGQGGVRTKAGAVQLQPGTAAPAATGKR